MASNGNVRSSFRNRYAALADTEDTVSEWVGDHSGEFQTVDVNGKLNVIFSQLRSIEECQKGMFSLHSQMDSTCRKVDKIKQYCNANSNMVKLLSYKSIDLEARERRRNLLIRGLPERKGENCFSVVRDFIYEKLGLDDDMYLERAHRLGIQRGSSSYNRPIIVAFRDFADTETILAYAYRLKNTKFGVDRDYPPEIVEARKKLWPFYKEARQNKFVKAIIKYPAKLVVNGVVKRDEFPDWAEVLRGSRAAKLPYLKGKVNPPSTDPTAECKQSESRGSNIGTTALNVHNVSKYSVETVIDDAGSISEESTSILQPSKTQNNVFTSRSYSRTSSQSSPSVPSRQSRSLVRRNRSNAEPRRSTPEPCTQNKWPPLQKSNAQSDHVTVTATTTATSADTSVPIDRGIPTGVHD